MSENKRVERFEIAYPTSPAERKRWNKDYSLNAIYAGKHWSHRREDAEYWHLLTMSALLKAKVPRKLFGKPVCISFAWNDRLDCSNHAYIAKMIEDALKGWLIADDSRRYVKGFCSFMDDNAGGIIVEVREL